MNIVEAYIKFNKQLLILISGLPGCGKTSLAKNISTDFKIKMIDQFDYYKKNWKEEVILSNNTIINNIYTDSAINWEEFNKDINLYKKDGLVVMGFSLTESNIKSRHDYHIHLNISKQLCLEKREAQMEKYSDEILLDPETEKLKFNKLVYPYYLESTKNSKINKFININSLSNEKIHDEAFDVLIKFINSYLYDGKNTEEDITLTPKVSTVTKKKIINKKAPDNLEAVYTLSDTPVYNYDVENDDQPMVDLSDY
jgi:uridine kinase